MPSGDRKSLGLRLRTRFWRNRLDTELVHGADPSASAELMMAARLVSDRGSSLRRGPATELQAAAQAARVALDTAAASAREDLFTAA